ncbi:MAG: hypothetical protein JWO38_8035 [Gemmataceae bacterium]|nr:hypothetical protein [Gemmataceae bacterium]
MPIHDWTTVDAGIFHHFHHGWVESLQRALNSGVLPPDYYAMAEQHAAGFGPDVLTLQGGPPDPDPPEPTAGGLLLAPPKVRIVEESDMAFYRRKQNTVAVRHVSDDRVVSMIEIVSPGNKSGRNPLRAFVEKAAELIGKGIHLLVLDLHPPGPRDPDGIHGAIWDEVDGRPYHHLPDKPLTLAAYEANNYAVTAYVEPVAVGDTLPDMPLYLIPGGHVLVPLEKTYQAAWEGVPARWRRVIGGGG